jgi:hypothetical protein
MGDTNRRAYVYACHGLKDTTFYLTDDVRFDALDSVNRDGTTIASAHLYGQAVRPEGSAAALASLRLELDTATTVDMTTKFAGVLALIDGDAGDLWGPLNMVCQAIQRGDWTGAEENAKRLLAAATEKRIRRAPGRRR